MSRRLPRAERAQRRIVELLRLAGHVAQPTPPASRSCHGKTQYGPRLARIVAAAQQAATGERIEAYACHWCPAHHIGHPLRVTPAPLRP